MKKVTDPSVLQAWEQQRPKKVTDPNVLSQWKQQQDAQTEEQPESQGWSGIGGDILQKAKGVPGGLLSMLRQAPGEVLGFGKQIANAPSELAHLKYPRYVANMGKGLYDLSHIPATLADYLGKKGFTKPESAEGELNEGLGQKPKRVPISGEGMRTPEFGFGLGNKQSGDTAGQILGSFAAPAGAASRALRAAAEHAPSLVPRSIARELSRDKAAAQAAAHHEYNQLFDDAARAGINDVPVPNMNHQRLLEHTTGAQHEALQNYIAHPTLRNAHWAQSELGHLIRQYHRIEDNSNVSGGLGHSRQTTLRQAIAARQAIQDAMNGASALGGHPEFAQRYGQLSHSYARDVVPYRNLDELNAFENNELKPRKLVKKLVDNDAFMQGIGRNYPGLRAHEFVHSPLGSIILGSLLGGAGFEKGRSLIK